MKKRKKIIIIAIIVILALLAAGAYLYMSSRGFSFSVFDFSSGTGMYDSLGESGNVFDSSKLNPFTNKS